MDKFNDLYGGPNYTRLFLLFFLFLVVMFYWMSNDIYGYVDDMYSNVGGVVEENK